MVSKVMPSIVLFLSVICAIPAVSKGECQTYYEFGVSDNDKNIIVNKHNELRALIANGQVAGQPQATNMGNLQWDDYLAGEAQKIAQTCVFEHVKVNDDRWYVGQNLMKSWGSGYSQGADWNGCVQGWFDEHTNFIYPTTSTGTTGHYTQVVWANTKYVGCGFTNTQNNGQFEKFYVCNYGPGGNWAGEAPYEIN